MAKSKENLRKTSADADSPTLPPSSKSQVESNADQPTIDQSSTSKASNKKSRAVNWDKVRFFGDYELLEEIARGGMGVVFKAKQGNLNRIVALKMILAGNLATEQDVKRFYTEAEAAANLQNPNIVAIYEVGSHDGQHYYSMEFIEGRSLADVVRENPVPSRTAARYTKAIAEAIQYAHERGTLHRDLKPSNILIDEKDQPRITDFGLAKQIHSDSNLTASGAVLGTPSYISPEQVAAKGIEIGPGTDVYSIGALLYELLTGRPPFKSDTPLQTIEQVLNREPAPPCLLNPAVPKDLETICLKCLRKEPKRRYATAGELADELQRFMSGQPIHARPVGRLERTVKWARRQPALAALAVLSVLAVIGILTGITWHNASLQRMTEKAELSEDLSSRALARSLFEQARSERRSGLPGRRWRAEQLMDKALAAIPEETSGLTPSRDAIELTPTAFELRSEIVAALLMSDMELQTRWKGSIDTLSPDGQTAIINEAWLPGRSRYRAARTDTGTQIADLSGYDIYALSPQGEYLAAARRNDQQVAVQVTGTPQFKHIFEWPSLETGLRVSSAILKFSPNGQWLMGIRRLYSFGGRKASQLVVWQLAENGAVIVLPNSTPGLVDPQFSLDGDHLAFMHSDERVRVWDLKADRKLVDVDNPNTNYSIDQLAISSGGKFLGLGMTSARRSMIVIVDLDSNEKALEMPVAGGRLQIRAMEFSPQGQRIAMATSQRKILIVDVAMGSTILELDHDANSFSWSGARVESEIISGGSGSLNKWRIATADYLTPVRLGANTQTRVSSFKLSGDGRALACIENKKISVHEWPSGKLRWSTDLQYKITDFGFCQDDSQLFASGFQSGLILDARNGDVVSKLPSLSETLDRYQGIFVAPEQLLFIGEQSGNLAVWDGFTNVRSWPSQDKAIRSVANEMQLSRDASRVAFTSVTPLQGKLEFAGHVEIWDRNANLQLHAIPGTLAGGFSPDNRWFSTTRLMGQDAAQTDQVTAVMNLLSRPLQDEQVTYSIWNLQHDAAQIEFNDESPSIMDASKQKTLIQFSNDGNLLLIVKTDSTALLWEMNTQQKLFEFSLDQLQGVAGGLKQAQFSPDKNALVCLFENSNALLIIELEEIRKHLVSRDLGWKR